MRKIILFIISGMLLAGCAASSAIRYPPSRWVKDNDRLPIDEPKARSEYTYAMSATERKQAAAFEKITAVVGLPKTIVGGEVEAENVDNFDEAPDSTWFTNRIGRFDMTPQQIARGANIDGSPKDKDKLTIEYIGDKDLPPELVVNDGKGARYFLKFDSPKEPDLPTGAAVTDHRLLYAFGYNVPESHIVNLDRKNLLLSPDSRIPEKYGKDRSATDDDLEDFWKRVAPDSGKMRALSIKEPGGDYLGPFSFRGKRHSDKNDRVSHENRRELRGLAIFCAFMNCEGIIDAYTADTFIKSDGEMGYLLHYIIFGGAKSRDGDYNPAKWSARYPNAAFYLATLRDGFWAAAILSKLSDDAIDAAVNEAKYPAREAREAAAAALKDRRDKTVAYWLTNLSPLTDFDLTKDAGGLLVKFSDRSGKNIYRYRLRTERGRGILKDWTDTSETTAVIESGVVDRIFKKRLYVLELQAKKPDDKWWLPPVDLFLKRTGENEITLMGIARRYR